MTQAAKIRTKPIITEVMIPLARPKILGLAPAKKNITPPIISIKTAITGTKLNIMNLMILFIITNKSQNSQGQFAVPQGTNPSVGQLTPPAIATRGIKIKLNKNIFSFIL